MNRPRNIAVEEVDFDTPVRITSSNMPRSDLCMSSGLYINNIQLNRVHDSSDKVIPWSMQFCSMTCITEGCGTYNELNQEPKTVKPGHLIVTLLDKVHWFDSDSSLTVDVITFQGTMAERLQNSGIIRSGIYQVGSSRALQQIIEYASAEDDLSQLKAHTRLQDLIIHLHGSQSICADHPCGIDQLIADMNEDPCHWWTVTEMAARCGICVDYFRRVFKSRTGVAPKYYIEKLKMNCAGYDLRSGMSVKAVAERYGYKSYNQFSKRFKDIMSMSPSEVGS